MKSNNGFVVCKDLISGEISRVSSELFDNNENLVGVRNGFVSCADIFGNSIYVSKDEYKNNETLIAKGATARKNKSKNIKIITQEELKLLFKYDTETGNFIRLTKTAYTVNIGDIAGTINFYGYVVIGIKRKYYTAHRLAWLYVYGEWPKDCIDHINGIKVDNRIENLRQATKQENSRNRGKTKSNTSGYKGVFLDTTTSKYVAIAVIDYKHIRLGLYDSAEDASKVYEEYTKIHFKEFYF